MQQVGGEEKGGDPVKGCCLCLPCGDPGIVLDPICKPSTDRLFVHPLYYFNRGMKTKFKAISKTVPLISMCRYHAFIEVALIWAYN